MDARRFDRLTRALFVAVTRRGAVRGLASGVAVIGGLALGRDAADAKSVRLTRSVGTEDTDPTCKHKRPINNKICATSGCTKDRDCFCTKTVNGQKRCVRYNNQRLHCPTRDECDRNKDCRASEVCVLVGGCCGHRGRHKCVPLCD